MNPKRLQFLVEAVVQETLDNGTLLQPHDRERLRHLRFSGLPFCAIRWFAQSPQALAKASHKPFLFNYYTRIGTVVHEVFQSALVSLIGKLPKSVELVADWECASCKSLHRFQPLPGHCSSCGGRTLHFREHTISYTFRFRTPTGQKVSMKALGHVDLILRVTDGKRVYYIIVDFKTSSVGKTSSPDFTVSAEYAAQIESYAAMVAHMQDVDVAGVAIVYIPRDSPHRFLVKATSLDHSTLKIRYDAMKRSLKELHTVHHARGMEDLLPLVGSRPCRKDVHPDFVGCRFASQCAGDDDRCSSLVETTMLTLQRANRFPLSTVLHQEP